MKIMIVDDAAFMCLTLEKYSKQQGMKPYK